MMAHVQQEGGLSNNIENSHKINNMAGIRRNSLEQKETNVLKGFAYPVIETFYNENFNMVFVQARSEAEVKAR